MRIDKYLWCIRFYKTRSLSSESCKKNRIKVNNIIAKASKEVYIGDKIDIRANQINYLIIILDFPKSRVGAKLLDSYRRDITLKEDILKKESMKYSKEYYRKKGEGRPTKKDRRDLAEYTQKNN